MEAEDPNCEFWSHRAMPNVKPYLASSASTGVLVLISFPGIPRWRSAARRDLNTRPSEEGHPKRPRSGRSSIWASREMASHRVRSVRRPVGSSRSCHSPSLNDIPPVLIEGLAKPVPSQQVASRPPIRNRGIEGQNGVCLRLGINLRLVSMLIHQDSEHLVGCGMVSRLHTTANDPAQADRASSVRLPTERRSRPCLQPDSSTLFSLIWQRSLAPPSTHPIRAPNQAHDHEGRE